MGKNQSFWSISSKALRKEFLPYTAAYLIGSILTVRIFFERWDVACLLTVCGIPVYFYKLRRWLSARRQTRADMEFYMMLRQISMALSSGSTLENAVRETAAADRKHYRIIGEELAGVYRLLRNHYPPDAAFRIFAERSGSRDALTFSEVLAAGIPAGINFVQLIRYLSAAFCLKEEVEQEIGKILNAPRYNNRIILVMPVCCILLFRRLAPSYLEPLYHSGGRIVMIAVFILLLAAGWIGDRLSNIKY